jgi:hypothetical protein
MGPGIVQRIFKDHFDDYSRDKILHSGVQGTPYLFIDLVQNKGDTSRWALNLRRPSSPGPWGSHGNAWPWSIRWPKGTSPCWCYATHRRPSAPRGQPAGGLSPRRRHRGRGHAADPARPGDPRGGINHLIHMRSRCWAAHASALARHLLAAGMLICPAVFAKDWKHSLSAGIIRYEVSGVC